MTHAMTHSDPTGLAKRSVMIAGHKTSISLEHAFWSALKGAARRRGTTINDLVATIDSRRTGNLSSAIRVFLLLEHGADQRGGDATLTG